MFCKADIAESCLFPTCRSTALLPSFSKQIAEAKLVALNLTAKARVIEYRGRNADHIHPLG